MVHSLRHLRFSTVGRIGRSVVHPANVSTYTFFANFFTGPTVQLLDHHVLLHDNSIFR